MGATRASVPVTVFSFVGNLGCIRFPVPIRKASGVKRGDRLAVTVSGAHAVVLEKITNALATDGVELEACACMAAPEGCGGTPGMVSVGWSYVQLDRTLATKLGFVEGKPIKITAGPSEIAVSLHRNTRDLVGVPRPACPP